MTTDLDRKARELLAAEYERDGMTWPAERLRDAGFEPELDEVHAIRAITAALRLAVPDGWRGTDIDLLHGIVLDATGCMTGLAIYIVNPKDGGPNVRQGRYDAAFGFVDSTTGMAIQIDAWSVPIPAAPTLADEVES